MNDFNDFEPRRSSNIFRHTGFRVGFIGILLMALLRGFFLLLQPEKVDGNLLVWLIQWAVYPLLARVAAQQHYDQQERDQEALRGVRGAGVGAALITSLGIWAFIIITAILMDANGVQILMEPISVCGWIIFDVILALSLGSWGGNSIVNKYKNFTGWDDNGE